MVERRLAKANVASSNLVSRSIVETRHFCKKTGSHLSFLLIGRFLLFPEKFCDTFRERSGRTAFQEIFLFYQQLLPETYSFPLVSLLFCRTAIRFLSAFARLPKSNRLKIKTRLLPRFLRAFTYNIFFMSSSRLTMPSIASCVCLRVSPYTSSCTRPTR